MAFRWAFGASMMLASLTVANPVPSSNNDTSASTTTQPAVTDTAIPEASTLATPVAAVKLAQGKCLVIHMFGGKI